VKHRITRDKIQAAVCITATAAALLFMTENRGLATAAPLLPAIPALLDHISK